MRLRNPRCWGVPDQGGRLLWLLGNHDTRNYGKRIFEGLNTNRILTRDWDAKLRLVSPCGEDATVWARHDFKGSSICSELHGLKRAAMIDEHADAYVAFHTATPSERHRRNWPAGGATA